MSFVFQALAVSQLGSQAYSDLYSPLNFKVVYDGNPFSALILEENQLVKHIDLSSSPLGSNSFNFSYSPIENGERKLEILLSPYHILQV